MKILFTGDSITDCGRFKDQPASLGQGYALMAAGELSFRYPSEAFTFVNTGLSGHKITDLLARWRRDCINHKPDIVSILIGINDVLREFLRDDGVSAIRFEELYNIILEETISSLPGVKIILCEPFILDTEALATNYNHPIQELQIRQQAVKRLAQKHGCIFIPLQAAFDSALKTAPATFWVPDGIHPSPAGHNLIAREWAKAVSLLHSK